MKFLVTGGSGFVGRHLVKYLKTSGHQVDAPSHSVFDLEHYNKRDSDYGYDKQYDYIIHLACHTKAGDWCLTHKAEQFEINQKINTNILEFWHYTQSQAKMIAMGTSCSYDPFLPLREDNYLVGYPDEGLSTYAYTKRMLLVGLKSYAEQYGLKYNYLIPSTIYGPYFEETDSHFIFDLIKKIYAGKIENKEVVLWGDGNQKRELIYVDDVVRTICDSMYLENKVMNLGYGREYPIKEYAKFICNYLQFDYHKIIFDTTKYVGVKSKLLDITNTEKLLPDYRFKLTGLPDGLNNTLNFYKDLKNVRT